MKCPNCRKKATLDHFRTSPDCDAYVASLCALRSASKRTTVTRAGGRPKKIVDAAMAKGDGQEWASGCRKQFSYASLGSIYAPHLVTLLTTLGVL